MRRALAPAIAAALVLVLAGPALAKVAGTAFINGPGIGGGSGGQGGGGTIRMDGTDGSGYPVLSGLLDPAASMTKRPKGDLGPRYQVRFVIHQPRGEPPIVQHLYPFAEGGPVLYTPPGQRWIGSATGEAPDGWFAAPPELIAELEARGLPERSPPADPDRPHSVPSPASGPSPMLLIVGIAAAIAVAAVAAGRRRAAARPARSAS
jgi:hypothetical protein